MFPEISNQPVGTYDKLNQRQYSQQYDQIRGSEFEINSTGVAYLRIGKNQLYDPNQILFTNEQGENLQRINKTEGQYFIHNRKGSIERETHQINRIIERSQSPGINQIIGQAKIYNIDRNTGDSSKQQFNDPHFESFPQQKIIGRHLKGETTGNQIINGLDQYEFSKQIMMSNKRRQLNNFDQNLADNFSTDLSSMSAKKYENLMALDSNLDSRKRTSSLFRPSEMRKKGSDKYLEGQNNELINASMIELNREKSNVISEFQNNLRYNDIKQAKSKGNQRLRSLNSQYAQTSRSNNARDLSAKKRTNLQTEKATKYEPLVQQKFSERGKYADIKQTNQIDNMVINQYNSNNAFNTISSAAVNYDQLEALNRSSMTSRNLGRDKNHNFNNDVITNLNLLRSRVPPSRNFGLFNLGDDQTNQLRGQEQTLEIGQIFTQQNYTELSRQLARNESSFSIQSNSSLLNNRTISLQEQQKIKLHQFDSPNQHNQKFKQKSILDQFRMDTSEIIMDRSTILKENAIKKVFQIEMNMKFCQYYINLSLIQASDSQNNNSNKVISTKSIQTINDHSQMDCQFELTHFHKAVNLNSFTLGDEAKTCDEDAFEYHNFRIYSGKISSQYITGKFEQCFFLCLTLDSTKFNKSALKFLQSVQVGHYLRKHEKENMGSRVNPSILFYEDFIRNFPQQNDFDLELCIPTQRFLSMDEIIQTNFFQKEIGQFPLNMQFVEDLLNCFNQMLKANISHGLINTSSVLFGEKSKKFQFSYFMESEHGSTENKKLLLNFGDKSGNIFLNSNLLMKDEKSDSTFLNRRQFDFYSLGITMLIFWFQIGQKESNKENIEKKLEEIRKIGRELRDLNAHQINSVIVISSIIAKLTDLKNTRYDQQVIEKLLKSVEQYQIGVTTPEFLREIKEFEFELEGMFERFFGDQSSHLNKTKEYEFSQIMNIAQQYTQLNMHWKSSEIYRELINVYKMKAIYDDDVGYLQNLRYLWQSLLAQGRKEEAIKRFEEYSENRNLVKNKNEKILPGRNIKQLMGLGKVLALQGNDEEASQIFNQILVLRCVEIQRVKSLKFELVDLIESHFMEIGRFYQLMTNQNNETVKYFNKSIEYLQQKDKVIRESKVSMDKNEYELFYFLLMETHIKMGEIVMEKAGNEIKLLETAYNYYNIACDIHQQSQYAQYLQSGPSYMLNLIGLFQMGIIYQRQGNEIMAISKFEEAENKLAEFDCQQQFIIEIHDLNREYGLTLVQSGNIEKAWDKVERLLANFRFFFKQRGQLKFDPQIEAQLMNEIIDLINMLYNESERGLLQRMQQQLFQVILKEYPHDDKIYFENQIVNIKKGRFK